jgi:hypothetical protein
MAKREPPPEKLSLALLGRPGPDAADLERNTWDLLARELAPFLEPIDGLLLARYAKLTALLATAYPVGMEGPIDQALQPNPAWPLILSYSRELRAIEQALGIGPRNR